MINIIIRRRSIILVFLDASAIALAMLLAFYLRLEKAPEIAKYLLAYWWVIPLSIVIRLSVFYMYNIYSWAWQYMGVKETTVLIRSVAVTEVLLAGIMFIIGRVGFPISILGIDFLLCLSFLLGIRLAIRVVRERRMRARIAQIHKNTKVKNALIIGAGDAGEMIAREMLKLPELGYKPVVFVDDNPIKAGQYIHGIPIQSEIKSISDYVKKYQVDEIIIAIPSASGHRIREIIEICKNSKVKFKTIPGVNDLIDGSVSIKQIRDVQIEDLLRREPVKVDLKQIASYLTGERVLVTGAGGSIGSEICRQVASYSPQSILLLGKGEFSIFEIEIELKKKFPDLKLDVVIGDIRNTSKLKELFKRFKPTIVFHAAAHKHVPLMENNPDEAVLNNIVGTKNLVECSKQFGVKRFVMISSDKAVNPSSVMGTTKKIAEMLVQTAAHNNPSTKFVSVRFGNVLESRGSVVPLFKKQITAGGPVTVTHPDIKRYFMTIPEAVQLVIQAAAMGEGGEIFILDMGEPVKISDLAADLIKLSGFDVGTDIEIQYVGLRPGEKMFEELLTSAEKSNKTKHKKIFVARPNGINPEKLEKDISELEELANNLDFVGIRNKLAEIIK